MLKKKFLFVSAFVILHNEVQLNGNNLYVMCKPVASERMNSKIFREISCCFFSLHTMEGNDHHNHLVTSILQSALQKNKKIILVCKDMKGSKLGELFCTLLH